MTTTTKSSFAIKLRLAIIAIGLLSLGLILIEYVPMHAANEPDDPTRKHVKIQVDSATGLINLVVIDIRTLAHTITPHHSMSERKSPYNLENVYHEKEVLYITVHATVQSSRTVNQPEKFRCRIWINDELLGNNADNTEEVTTVKWLNSVVCTAHS